MIRAGGLFSPPILMAPGLGLCTGLRRERSAINPNLTVTNSEGALPEAGLILSGSTLYGTTYTGGSFGNGTVFAVNTDGTRFTNLYSFTALTMNTNRDGAHPQAALILSGGALYGTTYQGGSAGNGTVFRLSLTSLQPQLNVRPAGSNVVLTWPTNSTGFSLQATTNLASPTVWTAISPDPVVVNGQNTVTNPISGTPQFFRLSK